MNTLFHFIQNTPEPKKPEGFALVIILLVIFSVMALIIFLLTKIYESLFLLVFKKPPFVHFYPIKKKLPSYGKFILENEFAFYRNLPKRYRGYFNHRVQSFIKRYKFVSREGLEVTDEMKIKVAATWVMLTFGLRRYLTGFFEVVILYPDVYESFNGNYHYAEYNPGVKAIVFSWKHFDAGLDFNTHEVNLGLHQFAHVVHTASVSQHWGAAGALYTDTFDKIMHYLSEPENAHKVGESQFFRNYAYSNPFDFVAVVLEYFFETPQEFRDELPELYDMVSTLINYDPLYRY
jgi:MtfA peptidase